MKKLLFYIITCLFISNLYLTTSAFANFEETNHRQIIAAATPFKPSFIPKPDTLPGIEPVDQQSDTSRKIFTQTVLPKFAIILTGLTGAAALLYVIIGGARLVIAYGAEEAMESGKKQIIYGLIGFAISLLAYTVVSIIINLKFEGNTTTQPTAPAPTTSPHPNAPDIT